MNFKTTDEQKEFVNTVTEFVKNTLNVDGLSFHDKLRLCADFGLFGIPYAESYGGLDENYVTAALLMKTLGYACEDNGFVFVITNHIWACMNSIYHYGSEDLKRKYIAEMISGRKIGALAITEDKTGSNISDIRTRAIPVEGGYLISGSKLYISNGTLADVFLVSARTGESGTLNALSCFVCDKEMLGLSISREIKKMGLDNCPMAEIKFENCFVPAENILGKLGNGLNIINLTMDWERCFEFASHIGAMSRLLEECVNYINNRELDKYQAVTHKVAQMKVNIELAELLLLKIAWEKDIHKNTYLDSSIFKYFVSEVYVKSCLDILQIFGAYGYSVESGIEKEVRDALASKIYSGASEIQLNIIYQLTRNSIISSEQNR